MRTSVLTSPSSAPAHAGLERRSEVRSAGRSALGAGGGRRGGGARLLVLVALLGVAGAEAGDKVLDEADEDSAHFFWVVGRWGVGVTSGRCLVQPSEQGERLLL